LSDAAATRAAGTGVRDAGPVPYPMLFRGIFLVSFATLLFEVSLIRVLSFTIWHHFGYVVISTALLGFGASGSYLALRPATGTANLAGTLWALTITAAVMVVGVVAFVLAAPLDPMTIFSQPTQTLRFVGYQIAATVPFFFSGVVIALALRAGATRVDRLYFWDLIGAGLGCGLAVPLMDWVSPPGAVIISGAAFALSASAFANGRGQRLVGTVLGVVLLLASLGAETLPFQPATSKELGTQLKVGFAPHFFDWKALFRTDVVRDAFWPDRKGKMWGLSDTAPEPIERPAYFIHHDATAGTGIYDLREDFELDHLPYHVLRFPYLVANPQPRVLVIGVGGGRDIVAAMQFGASHVIGVELDPVAVRLLREDMNDLLGGFFRRPEIELVPGEGRHFVHTTDEHFDVIQLTGVDTLSAESSGAYVLSENFLYTKEAFHDYFDRLTPGGILSFAMGNSNPNAPKAGGRLVAIAGEALRARGITDPERYVAVVDSKALYVEVMIKSTPYTPAEVAGIAAEAERLNFTPLLLPGHTEQPVFLKLLTSSGAAQRQVLDGLRFTVSPTTDDRPFFYMFFRWRDLMKAGWGVIGPSHTTALGQIVLGLLVVTLSALGAVLILGPLAVMRRRQTNIPSRERLGILCYFLAIGLGFMLFEISLIQRFVLFLGYPTYSLSVTLFSLLIFLGLGSYVSRWWVGREAVVLPVAVGLIALLTFAYVNGLPVVQSTFIGQPILVRALITVALLAPLGLVLGMFFPLGIRHAERVHEDLIPWAWGINGCASVTGGVLTVVLAITLGFTTVWMISLGIYAFGVTALLLTRRAV
jgi:SAM-dependent methyltransferase